MTEFFDVVLMSNFVLAKVIILYFVVINILGLGAMFLDKRRAIKKRWRISEKTLFLFAILGGGIGCFAGMYIFRHKTQHLKFVIGMPVIIFLEMIIVFTIMYICK